MDPAGVNSQIWVKVGPQPSTPHWEGLIKLAVCEWKRRSQGSWIPGYWAPGDLGDQTSHFSDGITEAWRNRTIFPNSSARKIFPPSGLSVEFRLGNSAAS